MVVYSFYELSALFSKVDNFYCLIFASFVSLNHCNTVITACDHCFLALSKHRGGAYAMWQWNGDRYNNQNTAELMSNHIASIYNDSIYEGSFSDDDDENNDDDGVDDDDVTIMSQSDYSNSFNHEGLEIFPLKTNLSL